MLEFLHSHNYIHCDIKPDNFMVGADNNVYLIDYRLAQYFHDPTTHIHIPLATGFDVIGTIRYASLNSHNRFQQS